MIAHLKNNRTFLSGKIKSGYAVLELIFYISLFVILSLVVIDAMIVMARSFKESAIQGDLVRSGGIMERMSREVRQSYDIDTTSTSTDLKLKYKDTIGADKTIEFKFVSPNIQLWDNGSNIGNLNSPNIGVTALTFTQLTTANGKAVKILLTVKSTNDTSARTFDFYDTVVLRSSY